MSLKSKDSITYLCGVISLRVFGLMSLGAFLQGSDGHIYIVCGEGEGDFLRQQLKRSGIFLNDKIYGGVLQALDTIDEALNLCNFGSTLFELGMKAVSDGGSLFFGEYGADFSRIDVGVCGGIG